MRAQEAELLCFGAGEMLRYTARPVGAVERLAGGVRDAWRAGLDWAWRLSIICVLVFIWQSYLVIRLTAHGQDGARLQ
jgi:hypothetical protein